MVIGNNWVLSPLRGLQQFCSFAGINTDAMFQKEVYAARRVELRSLVGEGLIVLLGNNEVGANGPYNYYYPFRQDSSFLYFFGQKRDGLAGVIDAETGEEWLLGDDIDVDDIIWYGTTPSVCDMAHEVGVEKTEKFGYLATLVGNALKRGKRVHFLPVYRDDNRILLSELLGCKPDEVAARVSVELIKAVVALRSVKSEGEIHELERAAMIGYKMHTTAMRLAQQGVTERFIGGMISGIAQGFGAMVSFPSIVTMHGEIMHGSPGDTKLESGRLLLCDAGAETVEHYCSDHTRTTPVSGRFTNRQKEIYQIVAECHDLALERAKPGVRWKDVHMAVCTHMTEGLQAVGLMKGNVEESVAAGAHALFMPHGLGHMMGMDVHDMEAIGQKYVGFDDEVQPSTQFGLASLRLGRRLQKGFVLTDEPGIYFIPALIDLWANEGTNAEFLNFDAIKKYKDFGGIRIENDLLITDDGARILGKNVIPYHVHEVEEYIQKNRY